MNNDFQTLACSDHTHLWHPFTQQQEWCSEEPLIIVSGKGVYLQDIHGRDYIDGNSSIWTNIHGHSHPHIIAAIQDQAATLDHSSFLGATHPKAIELAERMVKLFPGTPLPRVFFSDNGSTAIESALKMAFQYWQLAGHSEKKDKRFANRMFRRRTKTKIAGQQFENLPVYVAEVMDLWSMSKDGKSYWREGLTYENGKCMRK